MKMFQHPVVPAMFILAVMLGACVMAPQPFDEEQWHQAVESQDATAMVASNQKGDRFFNPWNPMQEKNFGQFLRWRFSRSASYTEEEKTFLPAVIPDLDHRMAALGDQDFIAWIGHATFLIHVQGTFWITDPMLSKRALLPARYTPPAIDMAFLGSITAPLNVVISHSHYDHLDKATLKALPGHAKVYVPLGLGEYVRDLHDGKVQEMDWWEQLDVGEGISLTCLPAQHWSRRIGQDFNTTLWASYLLTSPSLSDLLWGRQRIFQRVPGDRQALSRHRLRAHSPDRLSPALVHALCAHGCG